jgi:hypothetical protein
MAWIIWAWCFYYLQKIFLAFLGTTEALLGYQALQGFDPGYKRLDSCLDDLLELATG